MTVRYALASQEEPTQAEVFAAACSLLGDNDSSDMIVRASLWSDGEVPDGLPVWAQDQVAASIRDGARYVLVIDIDPVED